ncbi:hypothetical protein CTT31_16150 [Pseudoalteromonas maricaloris]|uniref:hypothetical protein n=1 Tax=Pseudoalteromonas maricaloris TaxID=184924 RepID=UPI0021ADB363|nr:hypothetical protein [Pseudoalteromonas flavipulchra]USE70564.1 hypothetical protein CTT31_16150 [Pseudoalteromonas flavipulchra]
MLIYVNNFILSGSNVTDKVFSTIVGWLKYKTKSHFSIDKLKSGESFDIDRTNISTFVSTKFEPELYCVKFSHPDKEVYGRFWQTEITIKVENAETHVFVMVETNETSTQVTELPTSTRPLFVKFLLENVQLSGSVIGLREKILPNNHDDFRGLSYEIENESRKHPLVILSCLKNGKSLVDAKVLQEQLAGLAQVIYLDNSINSYDLANELGERYSAWDGAINIIYPKKGKNNCHNKLLSRLAIEEIENNGKNIVYEVLSNVTHLTNGPNRKVHISSVDVKAKRQRDYRLELKRKFNELSSDSEYKELAEQAFNYLDSQEEAFELKKCELEERLLSTETLLEEANQDKIILQSRLDGFLENSKNSGKTLLAFGIEKDLYQDEILSMVLELIKEKRSNAKEHSRMCDVLDDVLNANQSSDYRNDLKDVFKKTFSNYQRVTSQSKSEWRSMGFTVCEEGQHHSLKFEHDKRYKVTFAKTPSDARAGKNIISEINKTFF